jgi:hypothetical protein
LNKNFKIGIISACVSVILVSIPVYLFWMYSPEAVYRRGLASAFWLSLDNDTRDISVLRGETKVVPVELHHWKELDTALYVELRSDGRDMDEYPTGLSVSYDLDSSVISLSKGAVMVQSKNEVARFNPPMIKQVNSDGDMVVREFGNLTVSASKDVPLGSYYFELSTGDTKIDGGGGNSQSLNVTVVVNDSGQQHEQKSLTGNLTVYMLPVNMQEHESQDVIGIIYGIIGDGVDAAHYTNLGASPKGQYTDEKVTLTEQNITPELQAEGFKVGDTVEVTVYKKPAETVKFYIDPGITNPVTGKSFAISDIREDYSLGNGITCCGVELREDIYPADTNVLIAFFVVDQAYDEFVTEKLAEIKAAIN